MVKKFFLGLLFSGVGIFIAVAAYAQVCPHIYEGINCGANWYCNGCQTTCKTCPGGGDPVGATQLNYVSCTCSCPAGKIVCSGSCVTAPVCATPTREQNNSSCNGCGACKAGYSADPSAPDAPNPCLKAAYVDYSNTGTYFQISGDLKSTDGDLYLASGKAIRVDGAGTTTFNIGNFTGTSLNATLTGGLVVKGAMALTSQGAGTINAEQLCMQGSCRTTWPEATTAFIDEGNIGFGPTAVLGTNDNTPLAFETNGVSRVYVDTAGKVGIGVLAPNYPLDVKGIGNFSGNLRVGMGSAADEDYIYFDDGTKYMGWTDTQGMFSFNAGIFSDNFLSGTQVLARNGGYLQAVDATNTKSIGIRHLGTYGILQTESANPGVDAGNLVLRSDLDYPANYVEVSDEMQVSGILTASGGLKIGALNGVLRATAGTVSADAILGISYGGTGLAGTPTNGQLLIGNGAGYTLAALTGTPNQINVTNGAGSITLSTPQSIATSSTPTFAGLVSTATILAPYGTGTNASYRFGSGTENTGFSSGAGNQIDFVTSGAQRGYFNSAGAFTLNGDLVATGNTPSGCTWTAYAASVSCPAGQFVTGVRYSASTLSAYCCGL